MRGKEIKVEYDPKKDRLIITNASEYIKSMVSKLQEIKSGKPLSVSLDDLKFPKLGGILKGVKITEKDIRDNRKDLLNKSEKKFERG